MNAASSARVPWARLARRMMPNASDRPVAKSAKTPPRRIPWMTALTHSMRYTPLHPEIGGGDAVAGQLVGAPPQRHPALEQAGDVAGPRQRPARVPLPHDPRDALRDHT